MSHNLLSNICAIINLPSPPPSKLKKRYTQLKSVQKLVNGREREGARKKNPIETISYTSTPSSSVVCGARARKILKRPKFFLFVFVFG